MTDVETLAREGRLEEVATVLLDAPESHRRFRAAQVMGDPRFGAFAGALAEAARRDPHVGVRVRAARSLATASPDRDAALATLLELSEDPDHNVRAGGVRGLEELADERAIPRLEQRLDDPKLGARLAAVLALGNLGTPATRPALEKAARDRRRIVRKLAKGYLAA